MDRIAPKPQMIINKKRIDHFFPADLTEQLTPVDTLFATCSMGIPDVKTEDWQLEITGLVEKTITLSFDDLISLPKRTFETVYVCSGNPAKPTVPLRRAANVKWAGVDLAELLNEAGVKESATHLWSYGLDYGDYHKVAQEHYRKDMPLSRLAEGDVLIAYELNDAPLTQKNGFPARLVVPGFYGTNSVKWLCRLELADHRPEGMFTSTFYNDPNLAADPSGKTTKPVWAIAPECIFVSPAAKSEMPLGETELGAGRGPIAMWRRWRCRPTAVRLGPLPNSTPESNARGSAFRSTGSLRRRVTMICAAGRPM